MKLKKKVNVSWLKTHNETVKICNLFFFLYFLEWNFADIASSVGRTFADVAVTDILKIYLYLLFWFFQKVLWEKRNLSLLFFFNKKYSLIWNSLSFRCRFNTELVAKLRVWLSLRSFTLSVRSSSSRFCAIETPRKWTLLKWKRWPKRLSNNSWSSST